METFTLVPRGPFSVAASVKFLEGFTPAAYRGPDPGMDSPLELALPVEGSRRTVGGRLRQGGGDGPAGGADGNVTAEIVSPAEPDAGLVAAVHSQVERIL